MKQRVALVTGGMGGIGTAICQNLYLKGATVITSYSRNQNEANLWLEEQKKLGYNFSIYYGDVSNFESCAQLIQNINDEFGRIDILINNAGITRDVQLHKMNLEQWQKVMQTNLDSLFYITRQVINGMITRGYGRIINISSINSQKGQFGQVNYSAAKAGIHGFTKSLAHEVARKGITVNTISPGYISTSMLSTVSKEILEKILTQIPVGRLGKPEEVAQAVAFIAAEDSGFITGANLSINGGHYMT
jgi:acetoacetyl-CoA reductase